MSSYQVALLAHYQACWQTQPVPLRSSRPARQPIEATFHVLEFAPSVHRAMWTYATYGMSSWRVDHPLELHLFSAQQDHGLVDLLTTVAHYHQTEHALGLGHTVNFGVPWQTDSRCSYSLLCLPYLDGPTLEKLHVGARQVSCYWLVPITQAERDVKRDFGLEALEALFDHPPFDYLAPLRASRA
jgi:hypothetical protein